MSLLDILYSMYSPLVMCSITPSLHLFGVWNPVEVVVQLLYIQACCGIKPPPPKWTVTRTQALFNCWPSDTTKTIEQIDCLLSKECLDVLCTSTDVSSTNGATPPPLKTTHAPDSTIMYVQWWKTLSLYLQVLLSHRGFRIPPHWWLCSLHLSANNFHS